MKYIDIRLNILQRVERENRGTAEFKANEYLATTHSDLGTIKRAVVDLLDDGYIKESNLLWPDEKSKSVVYNIDTKGPAGSPKKDPKRLLDQKDIKFIRLYISLHGKKFLIEEENLRRTTWWIKHDWWMRIIYMVIGVGVGIGGSHLTYSLCTEEEDRQQEQVTPIPTQAESAKEADSTNLATEHNAP